MPHQQYQQTQTNSCGASSLLCASMELGSTRLPQVANWPLWMLGADLDTNQTSEMAIYSVTSGEQGRPPGPDAGYSLPSYIFEAAQAMGRVAVAYVPYSLVGTMLTTLYASDLRRAQGMGMTVHRTEAPAPTANTRLLRVVRVGSNSMFQPALGLHYILQRPDGSVMDPALGIDTNGLASLSRFQDSQGAAYVDTGIGIMIY
ncbi:MAG: hypothetical protein AAGF11_53060 [Myxococcota bacterium]